MYMYMYMLLGSERGRGWGWKKVRKGGERHGRVGFGIVLK